MRKILLVDDDADMREVMSTILANKYELKQAVSKKEGLSVLESYSPELIVLDVMMEDVTSGFEMARSLKNDKNYENIKILMVTNVDNEMKLDFKAESGDPNWLPVDDYIVKPIDPASFLNKIEKLIGI